MPTRHVCQNFFRDALARFTNIYKILYWMPPLRSLRAHFSC